MTANFVKPLDRRWTDGMWMHTITYYITLTSGLRSHAHYVFAPCLSTDVGDSPARESAGDMPSRSRAFRTNNKESGTGTIR